MGMYIKFIEDGQSPIGSCTLWVLRNYKTSERPAIPNHNYWVNFNGQRYTAQSKKSLIGQVFNANPK